MLDEAAVTIVGATEDELAGSIAGLGDIDGDGLDDVLVGATGSDLAAVDAGAAWVVRGGTPAQLHYEPRGVDLLLGEAVGDGFGLVGRAGDVDGDGFMDAAVGAPQNDTSGDNAGAAYVWFGDPGGLGVRPPVKLIGVDPEDGTGRIVSAGDIDQDGLGDLLVISEGNGSDGGPQYLVFGSALVGAPALVPLSQDAAATFRPETLTDGLARGAGGGDLDGDGLDDVVLGARHRDDLAGAAYLFLGSPNLTGEILLADAPWHTRLEGSPGSFAGHAMAIGGDVDGDGRDDLLVGAPYESSIDEKRGVVFVITSFPSGEEPLAYVASARIDGVTSEDRMGYDVDAGDLDVDGLADLQLGAKFEETGGVRAGALYLVRGGFAPGAYIPEPGAVGLDYEVMYAEHAGDNLGAVAFAGDTDGNGLNDFAVGAHFHADAAGIGYIVRCGPRM